MFNRVGVGTQASPHASVPSRVGAGGVEGWVGTLASPHTGCICSLRALFTKTQRLIPRSEISAVPEIAITFEAFAQIVALISKGCKALLASQRMMLLHTIPHNVVTMKRTTSLQVVL